MKPLRLVLLLAMALLLVAAAASVSAGPIPIEPNTLETEPNDDIDTANQTYLDELRHGTIGVAGDVDFYIFDTSEFDSFVIDLYKPSGSPLNAVVSLYDSQGNLLAESACDDNGPCLYYSSDESGSKYLKVSDAAAAGGPTYEYRVTARYLEPYEPNDFMSEAVPIGYDDTVQTYFMLCGDIDYFTFNGTAGDYIGIDKDWWYVVDLLDANGNVINSAGVDDYQLRATLPQTGTFYLRFFDPEYCDQWYEFSLFLPRQPLYVSFTTAGKIKGVPFTAGDVLRYWLNDGTWEMYIDMSDLGLKGNLTALGEKITQCDQAEGFLFGFTAKYTHPDLGTVQPQDLVRFYPESLGPDTSGWLEFWFDGSDMGLTTTDERIDAVGLDCWYELQMSTIGQARVPYGDHDFAQATFQNEDIVQASVWYSTGQDTDGYWYGRFDGSAHKLGAANVVGLDASSSNPLLSFDRTVKLSGITFAPGDIAECHGGGWEWDNPCDSFSKFFDASDAGVGAYRIDAFEVGDEE